MHDILRQRLMRKIESLPEQQVYQILDYIEFLESKYGPEGTEETSGLQRFGEAMEDKLRKTMSPAKLREAFQLISAADKVLSNVASAGKKLMEELTPGGDGPPVESEIKGDGLERDELRMGEPEVDAPQVDEPPGDEPAGPELAGDEPTGIDPIGDEPKRDVETGADAEVHRAGLVAIIGRPNVGKSTLLNAFLDYKLAIVSPKPQTTRHQLLGVLSGPNYQMRFLDTPGFLTRTRDALDRRMLGRARGALDEADLMVLVVEPRPPGDIEQRLVGLLRTLVKPALLAINKIDRVKKEALLPVMDAYQQLHPFLEMVPISARSRDGTARLLELIASHLPEGPPLYAPDTLTDRSERFLVGELVREQLFRLYGQEVPYDTAVEVEEFREAEEGGDGKDVIGMVIYVNKLSQRRILVGSGGDAMKAVGVAAREEIEAILGRPVYLELWVRVRPSWRQDSPFLEELGY